MRETYSLGGVLPTPATVLHQGFPEVGEEELVSVPDAKFTMGEFEVSMPCGVPKGCLGEGRGLVLLGIFKALLNAFAFFYLITLVPLYPFHR